MTTNTSRGRNTSCPFSTLIQEFHDMPATTTRSAKTSNSATPKDDNVTDSTPNPTTFQVLYRDVVLTDVARGTQSPQKCDVARLSDGRQVARFFRHSVWVYHSFPEDPRVSSEFIASGYDWETRWNNELEAIRIRSQIRALQHTALMADCKKFRELFPALADSLGLERERPSQVFDVGPVHVGIGMPHGLIGLDAWNYVDLHASGDFGTHGKLSSDPISPEQEFCAGMLKGERLNAYSIKSGSGIVRSEHVLPGKWQPKYREVFKTTDRDAPGAVVIYTLLKSGVGSTLAKIAPAGSER
jgi:hypothetical protein